jgi:hypothetical protein
MLKFRGRQTLAVLTIAALASFIDAAAQNAAPASSAFRDNAAWTVDHGVLTSAVAVSMDQALQTRATLADSVTRFDFRGPVGSKATLYLAGRYAIELAGNGDWQPFSVRFRAPRFDEGFNKKDNALALEIHIGGETRRNVVMPTSSPGAR